MYFQHVYISYLILESDITWIPSAMGPDSLPKATTTEGLRLQLLYTANVDGKSFEMSIGSWWTLSVGYEVEVWLSCNRFKSRILKRYLGEPLSYVRLQSCAPSVRDTLTKPPSWSLVGVEIILVRFAKLPYCLHAFIARSPLLLLDQLWIQSLFLPESWTTDEWSSQARWLHIKQRVNPYESPFSTSDQQIRTQKIDKLDCQLYTAQATQRPNLSQRFKKNNTMSIFFKRFVENSLAESSWKKVSKLKAPKSKIKWSKGSWTTLFCPLP